MAAMSHLSLMINEKLIMDCFSASPGKMDSAVARRPGRTLTYALAHQTCLIILTCLLACYIGSVMQASPHTVPLLHVCQCWKDHILDSNNRTQSTTAA